jgi:lipopolysaccharide/colanic/teichoic acid biosynthesis glycosyltransferase
MDNQKSYDQDVRTESGSAPGTPSAEEQVQWLADRPPFQRFIKRVMDIVASILLITFSLPLMIIIAIAIKLSSRGPLLFRQKRLGYHGREFVFLKFRSMYMNYDPKIHQEFMKRVIRGSVKKGSKMENDPRITPLGRFLRKSNLDELPQFFSVLKGDMSLVGPRPLSSYEWQDYLPEHKKLLSIKPGIWDSRDLKEKVLRQKKFHLSFWKSLRRKITADLLRPCASLLRGRTVEMDPFERVPRILAITMLVLFLVVLYLQRPT